MYYKFMSEWKEVLSVVITGLKNCGYKESGVEGMQRLLEQYSYIEKSGVLYRDLK